jgi:hypothetical protein
MASLPLITIAIVDACVAQLVIPGAGRGSFALAFRIAAKSIDLVTDGMSWCTPDIKEGRGDTCVVVRIEGMDDDNARALAEIMTESAISAARDGVGFATHRVEKRFG